MAGVRGSEGRVLCRAGLSVPAVLSLRPFWSPHGVSVAPLHSAEAHGAGRRQRGCGQPGASGCQRGAEQPRRLLGGCRGPCCGQEAEGLPLAGQEWTCYVLVTGTNPGPAPPTVAAKLLETLSSP